MHPLGAAKPVTGAGAKSASDGGLAGLDRDAVSERFESPDETFGEAIWVLAGEAITAEVVV